MPPPARVHQTDPETFESMQRLNLHPGFLRLGFLLAWPSVPRLVAADRGLHHGGIEELTLALSHLASRLPDC
jgi:hypothetical protein